jgi:3-oxoacyl-[acyl-carrier protein] reductase
MAVAHLSSTAPIDSCTHVFTTPQAIITGSGNGIGEAAAKKFAAEGCKVVVSDLDPKKSDQVASEINAQFPGAAISVPGDVTDPKWPELVVTKTIAAFGKLNIIVNNAGYTWDGMLQKTTDKQVRLICMYSSRRAFLALSHSHCLP